jgi:hypothetical protein
MAYGKVKVDTLTWDDSSTDTDVVVSTIAQKASPTFTGTVTIPTAAITTGNITTANITTGVFTGDVTLTGASYNVVFDASDNALEFADNASANFGSSSDLQIYHDSNNSKVHNTNNGQNLILQSDYMTFRTNQVDENILLAVPNGSVKIYHNGNEKIETTATGIDVTGTAVVDGFAIDGKAEQTAEALTAGSTVTIDCSTGNYFTLTSSANTTFAFSNVPSSGTAYVCIIQVTAGSYSMTWPSAVKWSASTGGAAPTVTASKVHNFMLATTDGGTTWRANANYDYAS